MSSSKNVHFGKLHAAHVDDPHNCGAHSGPLRQGSPHVFVQNRPLVREKDLPPCAGRPDHEPAIHCHVGEGGGSATKTQKGGRVQSAPQRKCTASGDPVDVATGRVFTSVFEFASPALPEFPCECSYSTEQAGEDGPLGWGWSHSLMQHLEYDGDGLTFCDAEGRRVLFPPLELGESVQHLDEEITLAQGNEGEFVLERADGLTLFFVDEALTGHARLQTVLGPGGQALVLEYADTLLVRLADTLGNEYRVESDNGRHWHRLVWEAAEGRSEQALVRWEYDREGNLLAAADALGQWRRFLYDPAHRLVRNTDRTGYSFLFEYDTRGRCVRTHGQDGLYDLAFAYTEDPPQTTERDADGRTTVYEYNDLGLVTSVTDAAGHTELFTYEGTQQTARTDALGRKTQYEYDPSGRVTAVTAPGGGQSRMAYDEDGPASVSPPEAETITRTETPEGRLLVTAPSAPAPFLSVAADPGAGCLVVEDGAGQATRLFPDEAGRLGAAETPLGRTLSAAYDDAGHLAGLADGAGRQVEFRYDPTGRLTAITRAGGSGVRFAYDPEGSLTHFTDGAGNVTRFEYAGFQQLRSMTPSGGSAVRMDYDGANRLHRLSDGRGSVWQFDYNAAGRVERLLHPDGSSEVFGYDPAGQVIRRTARSGAGMAYDYDLDGHLIALHGGDGTAQTFAYDPAGRLIQASCPGSDITFEYDSLGRLTAETSNGQSLGYAYDPAGRLASLTLPSGEQIAYAYDADGALLQVTDWTGGKHTFGYDAGGALETVQAANGVTTHVAYSRLGLPEAVRLAHPGGDLLADIRLRYSPTDALLEAHDSSLGQARFEYDPAGRLVRADGAFREAFAYDDAGNLTHSQTASGPDDYEYDSANRLLGGPFLQCRHDSDGHVTTLASPEGRLSLTYNAFGMLTRVSLPGGDHAVYAYDALGRRILKRVGPEETRFLWAGDLLVGETVTNAGGIVTETRDFLYPPGSWSPLAQRISGRVFCCHTDHRGAPTRLTDEKGHLAWSAAYTAFGQAHPRQERLRQPLRLPGQYHDEETGLHQNRWRTYDPQRGRYLSPDPLGLAGGLNLYAYAGSDPINSRDPLGLFPSVTDLASRVLGAKTGGQASQAYSQVQNLLHQHLSGMTPPFLSNGPSPLNLGGMSIPGFSPQSLGFPNLHLPKLPSLGFPSLGNLGGGSGFTPGINGFLPGGSMPGGLLPGPHHNNAHQAKHRTSSAPQAPPPAKAAHACTQKLKAMPPPRRRRHLPLPPPPPPPEEEHGVVDFTKNLFGFGPHHGGFYKAVTAVTGVGGPQGHGGIATVATNVVHDNWTFEKNAAADVYELSQGHPAAALQHRQAALAAFDRNIEVTKNLIPFGGSHGPIAQYGEVVFDNAYGLDDDAAQAMTKADADLSDQAYNDPVNFAMNFIPIAAEGRVLLLGRLTEVERAARLAGNTARAEKAAVAIARVQRVDELMRGGKLGTQTRAQAAALTQRVMAKAQARRLAGVRDPHDPLAPHTPKSLAAAHKARLAMQKRWHSQTHGGPAGKGQLAPVSGGRPSANSPALGRPRPMQMAEEGTGGAAIGRKPPIRPTGELKGKPTGTPEALDKRGDALKQRKIKRQNEAADALAYHGYKVEHMPKVLPSDHLDLGKKPDYRIEGEIADGYSPQKTTDVDNVRKMISAKVKEGQATRMILNMTDSDLSAADIKNMLEVRKPVNGGEYGPLNQVIGVRPKPGAVPTLEGGVNVYAPQDMDVFQIFP